MYQRLRPYLLRYRTYFLFGFVLVILKNLFQSMGPQFIIGAMDSINPSSGIASYATYHYVVEPICATWGFQILLVYIAAYLVMEMVHGLVLYAMRQTLIVASRKIEYDLRNDFFSHLQKMQIQFFQYAQTGDLMSRITNDLANVREVLGPGIMYTANMLVSLFYVLPMMIHISPKLTGLAFVPLVVLSFAINQLSKLIHTRSQKVQEKLSDISSRAQENYSGIRVVKSYVQEDYEISRFRILSADYIKLNMDMVLVRGIMMSSVILTIGLSVATLLWMGGRLVIAGEMSLGEFTAFNFYLAMLIWPMIALGWVLNIFQRGSASMKRMNEIFETRPQIVDAPDVKPIEVLKGQIEFRHLNFQYNGVPVLKEIDLMIRPGMVVGIVGHTGSGKSTLVNMIPRLFDIPPNTVFIDGMEIHKIPLETLRMHIGMVPQDTFLFSDTIVQNILFGVDETSMDKVTWAAETAQLKSNVEDFPEKYGTIIGERGITLSGGQKQRLAIARAVIREPKILILDDALSSVDTHTEDEILSRLKILMKGRTCLIVSHRIQTVKYADLIITLKNGEIIERGTHDELVARAGVYASMYQRQLLEEEMEEI
jgi:ATP-binding cassette subfamily B multidrug efflux pump